MSDAINIIDTEDAPDAIGPYSQAVNVGNFLYSSGQIALTPDGEEHLLKCDIETQTKQVIENIKGVLGSLNLNLNHIVKTTIFLKNMRDFKRMNQVYEECFENHRPARSTVAVAALPKDALVEIEFIAILN